MKVRTLEAIATPQGKIPAGQIISIPDHLLERLRGKVEPMQAEVVPEPQGDPVHCRFWFQVCWAVGMYQEQCTKDTDCRVYRFLERQGKDTVAG